MSAGRSATSQKKDWGTPFKYVSAVRGFFALACACGISLDPCSSEHSIVKARVEYFPPERDGLLESWDHETIFVNPPYGADRERGTTIANWLSKCDDAHRRYDSEVIALIPVATNTKHWKHYIFGRAMAVCFLYDTRLKFLIDGEIGGKGAPMACAMVYWGRNWDAFCDVFMDYGAAISIVSLIDRDDIGYRGKPR